MTERNSTVSDYIQGRHTRREAGIQRYGWQSSKHPMASGFRQFPGPSPGQALAE